jgi:hypothetical protein
MLLDITRYLGPSTVKVDLARQLDELEGEQLDQNQHTRERINANHKVHRAQGKGKVPWPRSHNESSDGRRTEFGGCAHTEHSKQRIGKANEGKEPVNKGKSRTEKGASAISRGGKRSNDLKIVKRLLKHGNGISYEGFRRLKKDIKNKRSEADRKHGDEKAQYKMAIAVMIELRDKIKQG